MFGLNVRGYVVSYHIQSECRKIQTRKIPNTGTFHAVSSFMIGTYMIGDQIPLFLPLDCHFTSFNNRFSSQHLIILIFILSTLNKVILKQPSLVFLQKGLLKICSKYTVENPCRIAISVRLQSNCIEITLGHGCSSVNLLHIFRAPFPKNIYEGLLLVIMG